MMYLRFRIDMRRDTCIVLTEPRHCLFPKLTACQSSIRHSRKGNCGVAWQPNPALSPVSLLLANSCEGSSPQYNILFIDAILIAWPAKSRRIQNESQEIDMPGIAAALSMHRRRSCCREACCDASQGRAGESDWIERAD